MEQIRNKSVSASEILMKMADLYKQTGDNVQMANLGVSVFGNSFSELIPLLKEGRTAIMARGNEAGILSKDEIESAALAKAQIERMKKSIENVGVVYAGFGAKLLSFVREKIAFNQYFGIYSDMDKNNSQAMARAYYGRNVLPGETITDFAKSKQREEMDIIQFLKKMNPEYDNPEKFQTLIKHTDMRNRLNMVNALVDLANKENAKTTNMPGFQAGQMAWATSLQAMGGGDVLSAMAQNPQQQIADNTAKSVEVLQSIDLKTGLLVLPGRSAPTLEPSVTAPK